MSVRLEHVFNRSRAFGPSDYINPGSATLTLNTGFDTDGEGRIACNFDGFGGHWIEETQTTPAADLMDTDVAKLGEMGRWYVHARGVGHVGIYRGGVLVGSAVDFDTNDLWYFIDTGIQVARGFTETLSLRVWGDDPVHLGAVYFLHRPIVYDAVDVIAPGAPNTTTVSDPGSQAATVLQYTNSDPSPAAPELIISLVPALSPAEQIIPLDIARGLNDTNPPPGGGDDGNGNFQTATAKNGVQFGQNNPFVTPTTNENIYRITPTVCSVNLGGGGYPPTAAVSGNATFDSDDVLDLYITWTNRLGAVGNDFALIDQLLLVRDCAQDFFDAYNDAGAPSFLYAWSLPGGAPIDHYAIVVTDQAGDGTLGDGNVLQVIDPATSPTLVTGMSGAVRVYLLVYTADGGFGCFDIDEETIVAGGGQIWRYM